MLTPPPLNYRTAIEVLNMLDERINDARHPFRHADAELGLGRTDMPDELKPERH